MYQGRCRWITVILLVLLIIKSSISPSFTQMANNVCKECVECVGTEGEEKKQCVTKCVMSVALAALAPFCEDICSFGAGAPEITAGSECDLEFSMEGIGQNVCMDICTKCPTCIGSDNVKECLVRCVGGHAILGGVCGPLCCKMAGKGLGGDMCMSTCEQCTECIFVDEDQRVPCLIGCVSRVVFSATCAGVCSDIMHDPKNYKRCMDVCSRLGECAKCVVLYDDKDQQKQCALSCLVETSVCDLV